MRRLRGGWLAALLVALASCSADQASDGGASPDTLPATPALAVASRAIAPPETGPDALTVLITNDEGIDAPGIDAAVSALLGRPGLEIVVVAPGAAGRSDVSSGLVDPGVTEVTTQSGYPARAVSGSPSDAVRAAIDLLDVEPDLVVVGFRSGQVLGPDIDRSGAVAAARAASARGIPALVVNVELAPQIDLAAAGLQLNELFDLELDRLLDGTVGTVNLNVPTCGRGMLRGRVEVVAAGPGSDGGIGSDCTAPDTAPHRDDVEAFGQGFATLTELP